MHASLSARCERRRSRVVAAEASVFGLIEEGGWVIGVIVVAPGGSSEYGGGGGGGRVRGGGGGGGGIFMLFVCGRLRSSQKKSQHRGPMLGSEI